MATKTEVERLSVVETKVDDVIRRLDKIDEKLDSRFAAKWTEWFVKGLIAFVLLWFLGQVAGLIKTSPTEIVKTVTGTSGSTNPSATANSTAHSDTATPSDSQTSTSLGGTVDNTLKQTGL